MRGTRPQSAAPEAIESIADLRIVVDAENGFELLDRFSGSSVLGQINSQVVAGINVVGAEAESLAKLGSLGCWMAWPKN